MPTRITSADVAAEAGVSQTTVSFVLRDTPGQNISAATKQRVFDAARNLGYVPNAAAQALAGSSTQTIGLVYPDTRPYLSSQMYLLEFLEGLTAVTQQSNHRILLESIGEADEGERLGASARERRVDGLILLDAPDDLGVLTSLASGHPVVSIGHTRVEDLSSVDVDNRAAAREAVQHLVDRGHREIACITNAPLRNTSARHRLHGYHDALTLADLAIQQRLVREGAYTPESGYEAMLSLLDNGARVSAAFVASDTVAMGALHALSERGIRVPTEMAIVGFDDVALAAFLSPALTTIHVPTVEIGRRAGKMLLDRIEDPTAPASHVDIDVELRVRSSS